MKMRPNKARKIIANYNTLKAGLAAGKYSGVWKTRAENKVEKIEKDLPILIQLASHYYTYPGKKYNN